MQKSEIEGSVATKTLKESIKIIWYSTVNNSTLQDVLEGMMRAGNTKVVGGGGDMCSRLLT